MKVLLVLVVLSLIASSNVLGQSAEPQKPATSTETPSNVFIAELEAARAAGAESRFAEAERHAELAMRARPDSRTPLIFLARAVASQCRGINLEANGRIGLRGVELFTRILEVDPNNLEAFQSIASAYRCLGRDDLSEEWTLRIAQNGSFALESRAVAYRALIWSKNRCASDAVRKLTQQGFRFDDDKLGSTISAPDTQVIEPGIVCATKGLEYADALHVMNGERDWNNRENLLSNLTLLTSIVGRMTESAGYQKQTDEARAHIRANPVRPYVPPSLEGIDRSRIINSFAAELPRPLYPPIAKAAHAEGTVYVEVTVDENGFVITADVVAGHPLLRRSAQQTATWTRFHIGKMKSRSGLLVIEFKL